MLDNIGRKLKTYAKIYMWVSIIGFAIGGIVMFTREQILAGILFFIIGGLSSWFVPAVIYGFGQIIENSDELVQAVDKISKEKSGEQLKSRASKFAEKLADINLSEHNGKTWKCKCGYENPEHDDYCRFCGTYK